MTIMLYPNKKEPKGLRVQDKIFKINEYFPFSKYGEAKALDEANTRQAELNEKRKIRESRLRLGINVIFKKMVKSED